MKTRRHFLLSYSQISVLLIWKRNKMKSEANSKNILGEQCVTWAIALAVDESWDVFKLSRALPFRRKVVALKHFKAKPAVLNLFQCRPLWILKSISSPPHTNLVCIGNTTSTWWKRLYYIGSYVYPSSQAPFLYIFASLWCTFIFFVILQNKLFYTAPQSSPYNLSAPRGRPSREPLD